MGWELETDLGIQCNSQQKNVCGIDPTPTLPKEVGGSIHDFFYAVLDISWNS